MNPGAEPAAPARLTVVRKSPADVKTRQLVLSIDGEHAGTLLWGGSLERELLSGPHTLRVHNTLVWKTVDFTLEPGQHAVFEAVNRSGRLTHFLVAALGTGPLYVSLDRIR